jgi:hypothetical protein
MKILTNFNKFLLVQSMKKWGIKFGKLVPTVKPKDIVKSWKIFKGDKVSKYTYSALGLYNFGRVQRANWYDNRRKTGYKWSFNRRNQHDKKTYKTYEYFVG